MVFLITLISAIFIVIMIGLSTQGGRTFLFRAGYQIRNNNNARIPIFWILAIVLIPMYLWSCTDKISPHAIPESGNIYQFGISDTRRKLLDMFKDPYEICRAQEDRHALQAHPGYPPFATQTKCKREKNIENTQPFMYGWFCSFLFAITLLSLVAAPVYTLWALSDEAVELGKMAWEFAENHMLRHKYGEDLSDLPTGNTGGSPPQGGGSGFSKSLNLKDYLHYEFIFALVSEALNLLIHRRRV